MTLTAQNHGTANAGLQHIKAGNIALKNGKGSVALAHYIEATKKEPETTVLKSTFVNF